MTSLANQPKNRRGYSEAERNPTSSRYIRQVKRPKGCSLVTGAGPWRRYCTEQRQLALRPWRSIYVVRSSFFIEDKLASQDKYFRAAQVVVIENAGDFQARIFSSLRRKSLKRKLAKKHPQLQPLAQGICTKVTKGLFSAHTAMK